MPPRRTWHRAFIGTMAEAAATAVWLDAAAAEMRIGSDTLYAMQVCLEELLANIVMHGGRSDPKIEVSIHEFDDRIELAVEDDGPHFDITQANPKRAAETLGEATPGGLGIGLVQGFADRLTFRREGLGNKVVAEFRLPEPRGPAAS